MVLYDPAAIIQAYEKNAWLEDASEKAASLRVEIPRVFIRKYLQPSDTVLDAGGGTGVNAIMMAEQGANVTLLDITPAILEFAKSNIQQAGLMDQIKVLAGDITHLEEFYDNQFSLVVCVGDAVSYALSQRFKALDELVRVAQAGSILIIGCDSKLGFMRLKLAQGALGEAIEIFNNSETYCGMGPVTHLYTVEEMKGMLEQRSCEVLEVASTPTFTDTLDKNLYAQDSGSWEKLMLLELEHCTQPALLGMGLHLLFVARKK